MYALKKKVTIVIEFLWPYLSNLINNISRAEYDIF